MRTTGYLYIQRGTTLVIFWKSWPTWNNFQNFLLIWILFIWGKCLSFTSSTHSRKDVIRCKAQGAVQFLCIATIFLKWRGHTQLLRTSSLSVAWVSSGWLLIDWIEFYAVPAIFQPCSGGRADSDWGTPWIGLSCMVVPSLLAWSLSMHAHVN